MCSLFNNLSEEHAQVFGLVLSASGIPYDIKKNKSGWGIQVNKEDGIKAQYAIANYLSENKHEDRKDGPAPYRRAITYSGLWAALFLLGFHIVVEMFADAQMFISRYGASSQRILNGEQYRTATALMLHAGGVHLAGNMIGIALFGTAVCSVTGGGVGWLIILISGMAGNLISSLLQPPGHLSVGASTAVFGSIGFLAAHQFLNKIHVPDRHIKAWLPLGGGLALLGILGSGPYVDLLAHLFGFGSGIVFGLIYGCMVAKPPSVRYQAVSYILTAGILIISWTMGVGR